MQLGGLSVRRHPETVEHSPGRVGHLVLKSTPVALDHATGAEVLRVAGQQHFFETTLVSDTEDAPECPCGKSSASGTRANAVADVTAPRAEKVVQLMTERDAARESAKFLPRYARATCWEEAAVLDALR